MSKDQTKQQSPTGTLIDFSFLLREQHEMKKDTKLLNELISYFQELDEFKESLNKLSKYYKINGNKFSVNVPKSKYHYLIGLDKSLKGSKREFFPNRIIINEKYSGYFGNIQSSPS